MELHKRYILRLDDEDVAVTVVRDGIGGLWVETPGGDRLTDFVVLDFGRTVSLRHAGRVYRVDLTPPGIAPLAAVVAGKGGRVELLDELAAAARKQGTSGASLELRAEIPGVVVEVKVRVGDSVQAGQPAIVLEAMKMHNELGSPAGGTVTEVLVQPGQSVESGALLLRLGEDGASDGRTAARTAPAGEAV